MTAPRPAFDRMSRGGLGPSQVDGAHQQEVALFNYRLWTYLMHVNVRTGPGGWPAKHDA